MDTYTPEGLFSMLEEEGDDNALKMDGFDDCIIGMGSIAGNYVLIYDQEKILESLQKDMNYQEACEHFSFNIDCAHMGEGTPVIMFIQVENNPT